jgi:hypothetical protein
LSRTFLYELKKALTTATLLEYPPARKGVLPMKQTKQKMKLNRKFVSSLMKRRKLTRKDLMKKISASNQLLWFYFQEPLTIYKAERLAEALSTREEKVRPQDLIIW